MKQFRMKQKNKEEDFLSMLLGTLWLSLLENTSAGKRINRVEEKIIRAYYGSKGSSIKDLRSR